MNFGTLGLVFCVCRRKSSVTKCDSCNVVLLNYQLGTPASGLCVLFDLKRCSTDLSNCLTSPFSMVLLLFGIQSYFKSSTVEQKSVKMPHILDSCKFCWNGSAGSKFKVVYEVRRIPELVNNNLPKLMRPLRMIPL